MRHLRMPGNTLKVAAVSSFQVLLRILSRPFIKLDVFESKSQTRG